MSNGYRLISDASSASASKIVLCTALGKMKHRLHLARLECSRQGGGKRVADRAVNNRHLRGDAMHGQFRHQIGGAVLAREIKEGRRSVSMPLRDPTPPIA